MTAAAAGPKPKSDPAADYFAGAAAGSANIFTGYPFDTGAPARLRAACHLLRPPATLAGS
jgi:hypothetical protein